MSSPYGMVLYWPDAPSANEVLLRHIVSIPFTLPLGLLASQATAGTAATASTVLTLKKNGTSIGTVTYVAATGTFAFTADVAFIKGDVFTVHAPGTADATLAGIALTIMGTRSVLETGDLVALLTGTGTLSGTLSHAILAESLLTATSTLSGHLRDPNLLASTLLPGVATFVVAHLTQPARLRSTIKTRGSELVSFLTVVHDEELFR